MSGFFSFPGFVLNSSTPVRTIVPLLAGLLLPWGNAGAAVDISGSDVDWSRLYTYISWIGGGSTVRLYNGEQDSRTTVRVNSGSEAKATLIVSNDSFTSIADLVMGDGGAGYLIIEKGGGLDAWNNMDMGRSHTGAGIVTVTGKGSFLTAPRHGINVGVGGRGHLSVLDGGRVTVSKMHVGGSTEYSAAPDNSLIVSGKGSLLEATQILVLGERASSSLLLNDEATGKAQVFHIGLNAAPWGATYSEAVIEGYNAVFETYEELSVGAGHHAAIKVRNGGKFIATQSTIGGSAAADVLVHGENALWINTESMQVGTGEGRATVTISDGGSLVALVEDEWGNVSGGEFVVGSNGTVNLLTGGTLEVNNMDVTGAGNIANAGGTLLVRGKLNTEEYIGSGSVVISGARAHWSNASRLYTGNMAEVGDSVYAHGGARIDTGNTRIGNVSGSSSTLTVNGMDTPMAGNHSVTTLNVDGTLRVGYAGAGTLDIIGGRVISGESQVGATSGSTGLVKMLGNIVFPASWQVGELSIGHGGSGTLEATGVSTITSGATQIGANSGSAGEAVIRRTNDGTPDWTTATLSVGNQGRGKLLVDGATLKSGSAYIGRNAGGTGEVTLSNGGQWNVLGNLVLAGSSLTQERSATGDLTVQSGSQLEVRDTLKLHKGGAFTLQGGLVRTKNADFSNGTFNLQGGTLRVSGTLNLVAPLNAGTLELAGKDAHWINSGQLQVGDVMDSYTSQITLSDRARITSDSTRLAVRSRSASHVLLGSGSSWTNTGELMVGHGGEAALSVEGGSDVTTGSGRVGALGTSTGVITLKEGSTWSSGGQLMLGDEGIGTLNVESGSTASVAELMLANKRDTGAEGWAYVSGAVDAVSRLYAQTAIIGNRAQGVLYIREYGEVISDTVYLGRYNDSLGIAYVSGGDWNVTGDMILGGSSLLTATDGRGSLQLTRGSVVTVGGTLKSHDGFISVGDGTRLEVNHLDLSTGNRIGIASEGAVTVSGRLSGSIDHQAGKLTLSGQQAVWDRSGELGVGVLIPYTATPGSATLEVVNGAKLNSDSAALAKLAGSSGRVVIRGAGSTWRNAGLLTIGQAGSGVVDVEGGGVVHSGTAYLGRGGNASGRAQVRGEGSRWQIDGDLIVAGDSATEATTATGTLDVGDGGVVEVANGVVLHAGATVNLEAGGVLEAQTLDIVNGTFNFSGGTLRVTNRLSGDLHIGAGATFTGSSTVGGDLYNAGQISPGDSPGLLAVEGDFTQSATGVLTMEIGGTARGVHYDALDVDGSFIAQGILEIIQWQNYAPQEGDRFQLFTFASMSGEFDQIRLFDLIDGLGWDLSGLYSDGEIWVVAVPEPVTSALLMVCTIGALAAFGRSRRRPARCSRR